MTQLITYNTHLFLGTVIPGVQYDDQTRLTGIVNQIINSGADLVGLTEVWSDATKAQIVRAVQRFYQYSYYAPTPALSMGPGLLLLSKHLVSRASYTPYVNLVGVDAFTGKGFYTALVTIRTSGGVAPLFVALTHTQAGGSTAEQVARRDNLLQLASGIRALPFFGRPLFVIGDLNVCAEINGQPTAEYMAMTRIFAPYQLRDLCRVVYPSATQNPLYTYDWFTNSLARYFEPEDQVAERLDYVYGLNAGAAASLTFTVPSNWTFPNSPGLPDDLSDHYPVIVVASAVPLN